MTDPDCKPTFAAREVRMRTLIGARAIFNDRRSSLDCQVRNLTSRGAKLTFVSTVGLPNKFVLEIPTRNQTFDACVKWRGETEAGVEFLKPGAL